MRTINTLAADEGNKRGAAINAHYRNREMAATWTPAQQCLAQRALDVLDMAYAYAGSYINYRKKFIAVKLEGAQVRDRKTAQQVQGILIERGYDVVKSPQGIVVRIPR